MNITFSSPDFGKSNASLYAGVVQPVKQRLQRVAGRAGSWVRQRLDRARSRPTPPLQLELPQRFVRFKGLREFEFALASRVDFPVQRVREHMALTPAELVDTAALIRETERHFATALTRSLSEPGLIGEFFRELELKLFSQDHGWREIMEGLVRLSPEYDGYKRLALVKYMQYLRSRQNIIRRVFVFKTREDDDACVHATRTFEEASAPGQADLFPDTDLFPLPAVAIDSPVSNIGYRTLPKGETVHIQLGAAREMELVLAGNRMRLFTGRECYLVDAGNNTFALLKGRNLVGRHSSCDVVVDPACRAVSRTHLMVEPLSATEVLLTDLSSHGTEVPAALLSRR